jgi:hypothetical protein
MIGLAAPRIIGTRQRGHSTAIKSAGEGVVFTIASVAINQAGARLVSLSSVPAAPHADDGKLCARRVAISRKLFGIHAVLIGIAIGSILNQGRKFSRLATKRHSSARTKRLCSMR